MNGFIVEVKLNLNIVEVSGRPIHRLACLIPRNVCGGLGFEYVVPFVVK